MDTPSTAELVERIARVEQQLTRVLERLPHPKHTANGVAAAHQGQAWAAHIDQEIAGFIERLLAADPPPAGADPRQVEEYEAWVYELRAHAVGAIRDAGGLSLQAP